MAEFRLDGVSKRFGAVQALHDLTLHAAEGEFVVLLGPTGAGKTTTLRLLAGLLTPTSGEARIAGLRLPAPTARQHLGLISHRTMLYEALTGRENVAFSARLYGLADPDAAAERALRALRIADRVDVPVRQLSRGMQQRVAIARAMVHAPEVILCDEPYTGLDEQGATALTALLRERRDAGAALVLVTHHLHEGLALATHAAIMRGGRFVRYEPAAGLDPAAYANTYRALVA